jgi:hypothetical protein
MRYQCRSPLHHVALGAANENIVAVAADQQVAPGAADENIVAVSAPQAIVSVQPKDEVVIYRALEKVGAVGADDIHWCFPSFALLSVRPRSRPRIELWMLFMVRPNRCRGPQGRRALSGRNYGPCVEPPVVS